MVDLGAGTGKGTREEVLDDLAAQRETDDALQDGANVVVGQGRRENGPELLASGS